MAKRPLSAGDITQARCTRCREVTNHVIVAMVEDRVARVQCNICDGVHNYHAPAPAAKAAPRTVPAERKAPAEPKSPRGGRGSSDRDAWLAAIGQLEGAPASEYQMTGGYKVAERIRHSLFGVGIVTSVTPGKMEVLFENGRKLLRCGR